MRNGKLLVRPRLHLIAASCVAGILLAVPIPTDGQGPKTARQAGATGPSPTVKAGQRTGQVSPHPPCLCARTQSSVKRASVDKVGSFRHPLGAGRDRPRKSLDRDAIAFQRWRRIMFGGNSLGTNAMTRGQEARLLDEWRIRLIDGDTFAYGADRIRIKGIDTPEVSESGGFEASQRLDLLLREGPVMVIPQALDVYGRIVADVYVNDQNVADTLTQEGYAKPR